MMEAQRIYLSISCRITAEQAGCWGFAEDENSKTDKVSVPSQKPDTLRGFSVVFAMLLNPKTRSDRQMQTRDSSTSKAGFATDANPKPQNRNPLPCLSLPCRWPTKPDGACPMCRLLDSAFERGAITLGRLKNHYHHYCSSPT